MHFIRGTFGGNLFYNTTCFIFYDILFLRRSFLFITRRHDGQTPTGKYKVPGWTQAWLPALIDPIRKMHPHISFFLRDEPTSDLATCIYIAGVNPRGDSKLELEVI